MEKQQKRYDIYPLGPRSWEDDVILPLAEHQQKQRVADLQVTVDDTGLSGF